MWSLLHNPSAYPSAWTHTSSAVGSCFIYKLGMLTGQRFQAQLSPSSLWKFTEFRAETLPHAFGIPNCVTPPRLQNSSPRNPPSPLEFQDAARGMVWIFSGITQSQVAPNCMFAIGPTRLLRFVTFYAQLSLWLLDLSLLHSCLWKSVSLRCRRN